MRVLVDGFNIALGSGTGIATYGRSFLHAMASLGHERILLTGEEHSGRAPAGATRKWIDFALAPWGFRPRPIDPDKCLPTLAPLTNVAEGVWNRPRLFRAARGAFRRTGLFTPVRVKDVDIAHWTYPLPLFVPGARNIYTIHDVVPLKFPALASGGAEYRRVCEAIARRADHILTVSECSRDDLMASFPIAPSRISNSYQPFSPWPGDAGADAAHALLGRHGLQSKAYFLFFGAIEPKKNVMRMLDAYVASRVGTPLVVVSGGGWDNDAEKAALARLSQSAPGQRVLSLGYMPRSSLAILIHHARATLFPSLYEGFGLPVLESMAMGTAVITSDAGALGEVAGNAALLVEPHSVASICDAIRRMDEDASLRSALEHAGKQRADLFSADAYRARVDDILWQVMKS